MIRFAGTNKKHSTSQDVVGRECSVAIKQLSQYNVDVKNYLQLAAAVLLGSLLDIILHLTFIVPRVI